MNRRTITIRRILPDGCRFGHTDTTAAEADITITTRFTRGIITEATGMNILSEGLTITGIISAGKQILCGK